MPGKSRLKNANDSPNAVTNITGNAQLEWAEMNVSVGCTIDSMALYIGDQPRRTLSSSVKYLTLFAQYDTVRS